MDTLRNLFGNLSAGIIRLLVTVGIIAAVGIFLVRPALDTTNKAIDAANNGFGQIPDQPEIQSDLRQTIRQSQAEFRRQQRQGLRQQQLARRQQQLVSQLRRQIRRIQRRGDLSEIKQMSRCLQTARGDLERAVRCIKRI